MSRGKELAKNTIIITIGKLSTQFVSFLLLPLYTSFLSTKEYGTVDLLTTYVQLLLPVVTLLVEQGAFRYLIDYNDNEEEKKKIISSSGFIIIIQCILYAILFICLAKFIKNDYKYYILLILIVSSFSSWGLQLTRGFRKLTLYAIGSFITVSTTIAFNIVFIAVLKMGAIGMLVSTIIGNLVCVVFIFVSLRIDKYFDIKLINKSSIENMLRYSIPLIPNQLSLWIINSSDRTIVTLFLGAASNGILAISHKFSAIYQTIFGMFQLSWHEMGAVHFNDSDRDEFFTDTFNEVYKFFSSMCIGLIAVLPFVFPLLINETYYDAYYTIPLYLLAVLCNIVVGLLGVVYVALKKTAEITKSTIYSAIINIVVHVVLIELFGLFAAAISTFTGYFSILVYRIIDTKKYINIRYNYKYFIGSTVVILILLVPYYLDLFIIRVIGVIFAVAFALFANRKMLFAIREDMLKKLNR